MADPTTGDHDLTRFESTLPTFLLMDADESLMISKGTSSIRDTAEIELFAHAYKSFGLNKSQKVSGRERKRRIEK